MIQGHSVVQNLNWGLRRGYPEWVWLLGDDHEFLPDVLMRLLDDEVEVVAPMNVLKRHPFSLLAWSDANVPVLPHEIEPDRLTRVHSCGSAGMLVRKKVLDAIGDPWFSNSSGLVTDEDVQFCRQIREAGFPIHVDGRAIFGHVGSITAWPVWSAADGEWEIHVDLGGAKVVLEAPRPSILQHRHDASKIRH